MGPHCPIDLPRRSPDDVYVRRLSHLFDEQGFEQGERINGYYQCPRCGLWWPCIEQPDAWEVSGDRWLATSWWGGVVCEACSLLIVEQPDGRTEVYEL